MAVYELGNGLSPDTKVAGALILDFSFQNCERQPFTF